MPLSAPVTATAIERFSGRLGRAAVASMQGIRNNFEDAHLLDQDLGLCGIFDGHLGDEAAAFCAERLPLHVGAAGDTAPDALLAAFQACDAEMRGQLPQGSEAGSTATLVAVREATAPDSFSILVASCGDSRAVLVRKADGSIQETHDHRPGDPVERERIEAAGGFVSEEFDPPRVDGQLACSRALGAFKFKQDDKLAPAAQKVSSVPEVYEWHAQRGDLLIVACDGIWDVFSSQRVVDEITNSGEPDLGATLSKVLQLCIDKEADDNLTLMAVELGAAATEERTVNMTAGNFLKTKDKEIMQEYTSFCLRFGFALSKEMKPKVPPEAVLTPATLVPGARYAALPKPAVAASKAPTNGSASTKAPRNGSDASESPTTGIAAKEASKATTVVDVKPLVIVGPSGVGKGTLINRLMSTFPNCFGFSVSHTTRGPRPGEVDGKDYHFVSLDTMQKEVDSGDKLIEHASVHSNMYGTSKDSVETVRRQGKICLLDIDVQGARQVKEGGVLKDVNYLFIAPPSIEELERRLRGRGTEAEAAVNKRVNNAKVELEFSRSGFFDTILVNRDLDVATRELADQIRRWYPALTIRLKVTAQRPAGFYVRAARELIANEGHAAAKEIEITGLGAAISAAAAVLAALAGDGHEVLRAETSLLELEARGSGRKVQSPHLRILLRLRLAGAAR
mmetsp:Transcript_32467/g.86463  ORF Transcript_32467/g.86463 Transcript_32467/m.86463 type:complete len:680 (-) Transcript_32467:112-2151(-)